MSDMVIIG